CSADLDSIAPLSTGRSKNKRLLAGFGTQVSSPTIANKTKQGIGRRIVVGQAEVRSTSNHFNKEKALNARNTRNSGKKKQGTYHITTIYEDVTRNKKTRTIYTYRQQITRDR